MTPNSTPRTCASAVLFAALLALPALADEIVLRDGRTIPVSNVHIAGGSLMTEVRIGAATGQLGYPINAIVKIRFPKPPQLRAASDLLGLGRPDQALPLLDPILGFYGPLKEIPGNWWAPAALLKTTALEDLRRENDAEPLLNDLSRISTDPESARLAKVRLAAIAARKGENKSAIEIYEKVLDESSDPAVLSEAWVDKGESLLVFGEYESALLAFLHIPVFYPDQRLLMPRALLGGARAFKGMKDYERARDSLEQLMADYGGSSESAAAKIEIKQVENKKTEKTP